MTEAAASGGSAPGAPASAAASVAADPGGAATTSFDEFPQPRGRRRRGPDALRLAAIEAPARPALRRAGLIAALAALVWPAQAAAVAWAIAGWVEGGAPLSDTFLAAAIFLALGALRGLLEHRAGGVVFAAADQVLAAERARLIARASLRGEAGSPAENSAATAAMAAQKLPMLVPYLTRYRPAAFRALAGPVAILVVTAPVSWAAALILLVAGPLIPVFMALIGVAASAASRRQLDEIADLNALLMERLAALPDIRLMDGEARLARDFSRRSDALRARTMAVLRIAFLSSTALELFSALGIAMAAVYVGFSLLGQIGFGTWGPPLTAFEGVLLLLLAPEFFQPLRDFAAAWHDRAAALALAGELAEAEASASPPILGRGVVVAPSPGPASIRLVAARARGVAFPDAAIAPGESVAVTGPSGAGKSTLLAALAGLVPLDSGRIEAAGRALDDATADAWRARLAWIPQVPRFPDAPLREALDPRGTGALDAALAAAGATGVIAALPGGLDARLGESGAGVSGGEARRLAVARALAARPDMLLADEPTADLDAETAARVVAALQAAAAAGVAVVAATHDPALVAALGRELRLSPAPAPATEVVE